MNAITPSAQFGPVSTKFAGVVPVENDLGAGVRSGYPIMKYKGKVWTVSYKGEDTVLMRPDKDGPMNSIDIVIVGASKVVSKIYYAKGYVEGSTEAPDCYSTNGAVPASDATHKQAAACALCPMNQWGSRITENNKKGKACQDSKRLAIVPADPQYDMPDKLKNELYGGPLLLRVPAASLADLSTYGERMKSQGYPYQSVITRISFVPTESYPKFAFQPMRPLTDAEADVALELIKSDRVEQILAEEMATPALPAPAQPEQPLFAAPLPGQVATGQPVTPQVTAPPPPPAPPTVVPQPAPVQTTAASPPVVPAVTTGTPTQATVAVGVTAPAAIVPPPQQLTTAAPALTMPTSDEFEKQLDALLAAPTQQ